MFPRLLLVGVGLLLLSFGAATLIYPRIFTVLYGVSLPSNDALAAIRAIVGGSEIGLGVVYLFRARFGIPDRPLLFLGFAIFSGIATARLYHLVIEASASGRFFRELAAEAFIAALFLLALKQDSQTG